MGTRRQGREFALQALYLADITKLGIEKTIQTVILGSKPEEKVAEFAIHLATQAAGHMKELDERIQKYAANWEMGRMAALDRNNLRLGAFELFYSLEPPELATKSTTAETRETFLTRKSE